MIPGSVPKFGWCQTRLLRNVGTTNLHTYQMSSLFLWYSRNVRKKTVDEDVVLLSGLDSPAPILTDSTCSPAYLTCVIYAPVQ